MFTIADAVGAALYDPDRQDESFFSMSSDEFGAALTSNEIIWAPDGDEAFDDGGHVLHFDVGDRVRLVAFKITEFSWQDSLTEVWLDASEFYDVLQHWHDGFEVERNSLLSKQ